MLGVLGAHNLVQNSILNEKGYVTGNLAVSALLVAIGRHSGASWNSMGLSPQDPASGLRVGGTAAVVAASGAVVAMAHPRIRQFLRDDRSGVTGPGETLRRTLIRFPIGTAVFEEVAFRGVVPAVIGGNARRADVFAAAIFAVWHLLPTARVQGGIAISGGWPVQRRVAAAVGGSAMAGVAGLGLSWLRRRTGSLLAPWLVHATVNSAGYLAGAAVQRRSGPGLNHARS